MYANRVARRLALVVALVATGPVATSAQVRPAAAAAVAVSPEEFGALQWLAGTWRGRMPDGGSFYERYTLADDSTFVIEAFADSTLAAAEPLGRLSLRGGALYRVEPTGERVAATRLEDGAVLFGTLERGFTWAPRPDGSWLATIHRQGRAGGRQDIVYRMEPYRPASAADREAVRRAVLDYVEALYHVDPSRIERSVHPDLAKVGFWRRGGAGAYEELRMTYTELRELAGRWNASGTVDPATAPKDIVVFDVLDATASAKLTAHWGVDHLHLARHGDRWLIVNVLWQSPPVSPPSP